MLNTPSLEPIERDTADEVDAIVAAGPRGALVVAGIATAIVIMLWFAFYLLVFLPRATP
jgi:predicted tellurium resistance membrane protein TerC